MNKEEFTKTLDECVPFNCAYEGDEPRFLLEHDNEISNIAFCVDLTEQNIDVALKKKVDTIVCRHDINDSVKQIVEENKINVFKLTSNHDVCQLGNNFSLAEHIGLKNITLKNKAAIGYSNLKFKKLIKVVRSKFKDSFVVFDGSNDICKKVATISGSGFTKKHLDMWKQLKDINVDVVLSADATSKTVKLFREIGLRLISIDHSISEIPGMHKLYKMFKDRKLNVFFFNHTYSLRKR